MITISQEETTHVDSTASQFDWTIIETKSHCFEDRNITKQCRSDVTIQRNLFWYEALMANSQDYQHPTVWEYRNPIWVWWPHVVPKKPMETSSRGPYGIQLASFSTGQYVSFHGQKEWGSLPGHHGSKEHVETGYQWMLTWSVFVGYGPTPQRDGLYTIHSYWDTAEIQYHDIHSLCSNMQHSCSLHSGFPSMVDTHCGAPSDMCPWDAATIKGVRPCQFRPFTSALSS